MSALPTAQLAPNATTAPRRERWRALALFLVFAGFYLLLASGHFYATDEETVYSLTESLVERHTLSMPEGTWGLATSTGQDGRQYAVTGPGQSFLAVPLYLLGMVERSPLLPPTCARLCHALRRLALQSARHRRHGGPALPAGAATRGARRGGALGLADDLWPGDDRLAARANVLRRAADGVAVLLAGVLWVPARDRGSAPRPAGSIAGGAALVGALAAKPHAALAIPFLGLYLRRAGRRSAVAA